MAWQFPLSKKKWLIVIGAAAAIVAAVLGVTAWYLARRYQPLIRERAIAYLQQRFQSKVELGDLRVRLPEFAPLRVLMERGRGTIVHVQGSGLVMRYQGRRDIPPMFAAKTFGFDVDLGTVFAPPLRVQHVVAVGLEISIPPKNGRPPQSVSSESSAEYAAVQVADVTISNAHLIILPKVAGRKPQDYAIHSLKLQALGDSRPMSYQAVLDIPLPPGAVTSSGTFGPWNAAVPADSPLAGQYQFKNADLGIFRAIAGIMDSTGGFSGTLGAINAHGDVSVPDFRLATGHAVLLHVHYDALVDGTNGNTDLHPVHAWLGAARTTEFTTSGAIIQHRVEGRHSIVLDVNMPHGEMRDLLTLAAKDSPFMQGQINMRARINLPPLDRPVDKNLILDGQFDIEQGQFLRAGIQETDELSRRGQGRPTDREIDEVFSSMKATFHMEDQAISFQSLTFGVPGAEVALNGVYNMDQDTLDFHGSLRLQAKVSETLTGWKRWLAKPLDPFFAKNGAGTFLRIKVTGSTQNPQFGVDFGR